MLMNWFRDEEGQAMVEYGLIIALMLSLLFSFSVSLERMLLSLLDAATEIASANP